MQVGQAGVGPRNQMTFLRAAAAAAWCSGSTAGISRKTAVCKFPGHSGQGCFCLREEVVGLRHVIWFRQGRTAPNHCAFCVIFMLFIPWNPIRVYGGRTNQLPRTLNFFTPRKQMNFAPRVLYRVLFCLLTSVKLWFKEKLEASTTQWTEKKKKKKKKKIEIKETWSRPSV